MVLLGVRMSTSLFTQAWIILILLGVNKCTGTASPWRQFLTPAMERAATYTYYLLGYEQPEGGYGHVHGHEYIHGHGHGHEGYKEDVKIKKKPSIWDGHIVVDNFLPSMMNSFSDYMNGVAGYGGGYGDDGKPQRVVKGWDKRIGLRLAIPYFGDFQYVRELGPGRFTDKLGPGKFGYPGLGEKEGGAYHDEESYNYDVVPIEGYPIDYTRYTQGSSYAENTAEYESLQNYPWYRRRK